jgi:hypothetical protein
MSGALIERVCLYQLTPIVPLSHYQKLRALPVGRRLDAFALRRCGADLATVGEEPPRDVVITRRLEFRWYSTARVSKRLTDETASHQSHTALRQPRVLMAAVLREDYESRAYH